MVTTEPPDPALSHAPGPLPGRAERPSGILARIEDALLALLLGAMIVLASLQILLRALDTGIEWADPLLRAGVLWVGLLGALAASREARHIHMDVLSRLLPGRGQAVLGAVTGSLTAAISGLLAWHGARFVLAERDYGSIAFSGIPAWALQVVIPLALGGIAVRYLLAAVRDARAVLRPPAPDAEAGAEPRP